jgi:hypothetical protein
MGRESVVRSTTKLPLIARLLSLMGLGIAPTDSMTIIANPAAWRQLSPYHDEFGCSTTTTTTTTTSPSAEIDTASDELPIYNASCYCGRVQYQVRGNPVNTKLCHCRGCQLLHGAPFEWVSIFSKDNVRFSGSSSSLDHLYFYSSELDQGWTSQEAHDRILPCKVSCAHCRTPVADEGRHMWLAFNTLFGFMTEQEGGIPDAFRHSDHLFYQQRCIDMNDDQMKWQGHRNKSPAWKPPD